MLKCSMMPDVCDHWSWSYHIPVCAMLLSVKLSEELRKYKMLARDCIIQQEGEKRTEQKL